MTIKTNKFRQSARGEDCTLGFLETCCHDPDYTIVAHIGSKGNATAKRRMAYDANGVYACTPCHDFIDGRVKIPDPYLTRCGQMERADIIDLLHAREKELDSLRRRVYILERVCQAYPRTFIRRMELKV